MLVALALVLPLGCADDGGKDSKTDAGIDTTAYDATAADDTASDDATDGDAATDESTADDDQLDDDQLDDDTQAPNDAGVPNDTRLDAATTDAPNDASTEMDDARPDDTQPDDPSSDDIEPDEAPPDASSNDDSSEVHDASVAPEDASGVDDAGPPDAESGPAPGSAFAPFDGGAGRRFVEVENNNSLVVANDMGYGAATVTGSLYPSSDLDFFQFELFYPTNLSVVVEDTSSAPDVVGCDERQIIMDVVDPAGTTVVSASQTNNCPWFEWQLNDKARGVAPGIYYIRVSMLSSLPPSIDEYRVTLSLESECGNGVVEGEESCEGDDGCSECQRTPSCGDGYVDLPSEGCEDTGPDDGCNEQCLREFDPELEPNDVIAEASERAELDDRIVTADALLGGTLIPPDNTDFIQLDPIADSLVYVSVYNTETGAECPRTLPTGVTAPVIGADVFEADAGLIRGASRTLGQCAAFAVNLTGGQSYFIQTTGVSGNRVDLYRTEVDFVELLGEENEGQNNTRTGALIVEPVAPMGSVAVHGQTAAADQDWYSVELPGRQALRVETLPGDAAQGSWCAEYDAELRVDAYNAEGTRVDSGYITDDGSFCGKLELINALTTSQRYDLVVIPGDGWAGTTLDYNVVFKTRNVAP